MGGTPSNPSDEEDAPPSPHPTSTQGEARPAMAAAGFHACAQREPLRSLGAAPVFAQTRTIIDPRDPAAGRLDLRHVVHVRCPRDLQQRRAEASYPDRRAST